MSPKAVLQSVKYKYPEIEKLPKSHLKLVESAVLYASLISNHDVLTAEESEAFRKEINPEGITPGGSLRAYRYREELTQKQLAKKSGITQANISAMEKNRRPIGLKVAKKLAKILNCRYQRLLEE